MSLRGTLHSCSTPVDHWSSFTARPLIYTFQWKHYLDQGLFLDPGHAKMATTGVQDVVAESVSLLTTEQSTATPTSVTELVVIPQQQLSSTSAADVLTATVLTTTTIEQEQQQQQQQQQYQHHQQQQQYHHQAQHHHEDKLSEDLLVSKALIEIGANEACRDLLNAGDEFEDFSALSSAIAAVCKLTNAVFTIHDCQTIAKANRSRCVKVEPLDEKFKYKYVKYVCKQFGYSRRRTVPGIRPNQKTYKTGCPALIAASVDREKQRMVIRSINLNHSHQMLGHMYPENRRQSLSPHVLTETYRLIDIGMKTKNIREYICNVTGKQLTTRDINNLKAKRKKELNPPLNHNTSNMVNHNNNNNIHNNNNNNNINNNNSNNIINCNDGHTKKKKRGTRDMEVTSPISSHVFDISKGLPATGVPVLLFIQIEKRSWKLLQKSASSIDGHVAFLAGQKIVKTTVYKLLFDTESYFKITDQSAFYPYIELVFQVMDPTLIHHIPIQISPHSYSCHRELIQQNPSVTSSFPQMSPSPTTPASHIS